MLENEKLFLSFHLSDKNSIQEYTQYSNAVVYVTAFLIGQRQLNN